MVTVSMAAWQRQLRAFPALGVTTLVRQGCASSRAGTCILTSKVADSLLNAVYKSAPIFWHNTDVCYPANARLVGLGYVKTADKVQRD